MSHHTQDPQGAQICGQPKGTYIPALAFPGPQSSSLANGKDWNPKSCLPCRLPSPGLLVTTEDFRPSSYRNGLSYGAVVKNREDPLEKEMATHSRILAWETPWTEEPGGLQPMGLQELDMT